MTISVLSPRLNLTEVPLSRWQVARLWHEPIDNGECVGASRHIAISHRRQQAHLMARVPTSGATTVTPYRSEAELGKVLKELCPEAEFSASAIKNLYWRLGAIVGRWSAEQDRLNTLSVARALTAISKNVAAAAGTLSAHQTGMHEGRDIEVVSQLKIVLIADPEVGSLQKADELISSQEDPAKLTEACLIAARNLKNQVGKSGRPPFDWYDDFTAMLLQIAREAGVEPRLWKDRIEGDRAGWLFEAAWRLESFLNPDMVKGGKEACGTRLDRSKRRLKQRNNKSGPPSDEVLPM